MLGWARRRELLRIENLGLLAWIIAAGILRYRIPYGVSHKDEAFYSAIPYSFLLGSRPYVEELALHQNAAILMLPFYRVYLAIAGSADGIILFNRYLYFGYAAFCSFTTFGLAKRLTSRSTAYWAAALVLTFSYDNLFALSYNTIGAFSFYCAMVWTARAMTEPRPGWRLFGASLFLLAGVFAYPALLAAALPCAGAALFWLFKFTPKAARRSALLGLGGGVVVGALALMALARTLSAERVAALIQFSRSMGYADGSPLAKLDFFASPVWALRGPLLLGCGAMLLILPVAAYFLNRGLWLIAAGIFALLVLDDRLSVLELSAVSFASTFLMAMPVLAPVCIALNRTWRYGALVLTFLWAPSVISMLCVAYASANGYHASSLGSLGALLAGVTSLSALVDKLAIQRPHNRLGYGAVLGSFLVVTLYIQIYGLFEAVYDESMAFRSCNTRVRSGPFRGTRTNRAEAERTMSVDRDLKEAAKVGQTLAVFDSFPSGYLSTHLRPKTFSHWVLALHGTYYKRMMRQTYGTPEERPDVILQIGMTVRARQFWRRYLKREYLVVADRPEYGYAIWQKRSLLQR